MKINQTQITNKVNNSKNNVIWGGTTSLHKIWINYRMQDHRENYKEAYEMKHGATLFIGDSVHSTNE